MPQTLPQVQKAVIVSILLLGSTVSVMSTDMYTPSMPHLPALLDTSAELVQLTLALNALAFGLAQLVLGPMADRYGRRPVFLCGIGLFALFSLACAVAVNIEQLILARILQGAAASVEAVLVLAIFTDIFSEQQRARVMAIYGVLFAVAPGVAPVIGGYVHVALGWRANFYIVSAAGLVVALLALLFLRETGRPDHLALRPKQVAHNYLSLLRTRPFMVYSLMMALNFGLLYAFIIEGPFLLIDHFGVATQQYGYYQLLIVGMYAIGSYMASQLVKHLSPRRLLSISLIPAALAVVMLVGQEFLMQTNLLSFMVGLCLLMFALAPLWALIPALAMSSAVTGAGTASALFGSLEMLGAGAVGILVSIMHDGTSRPMVLIIVMMFLGLIATWLVGDSTERSA